MTGTAESRRLQYGEEDDVSMLSIAISNGKVIPDTKAKSLLLTLLFIFLLDIINLRRRCRRPFLKRVRVVGEK